MRIILVLICSLALACVANAQEQKQKQKGKGKPAQAGQASHAAGKPAGQPVGAGKPTGASKPMATGKPSGAGQAKAKGKPAQTGRPAEVGKAKEKGKPIQAGKPAEAGKAKGKPTETGRPAEVGKAKEKAKPAGVGRPTEVTKTAGQPPAAGKPVQGGKVAAGKPAKPFKPQHFNLATKTKPSTAKAPPVQFQQNRRIQGSQNWQGTNYQVFRNYRSEWHDRDWWRHHHSRIVFIFGGAYFWNAGYWFPAWGYDPNSYYAYDGPIYGYHGLPPDQVVANVQSALQEQGYYHGEVDGLLGPLTRAAIADYQRDRGLYVTSAIDRPTLETLGMS